jgi:kumamolisin
MTFLSSGARANEVVWSDRSDLSKCGNAWGSGGGVSQFFDRATFQQAPGVVNQYSTGKRQVPDLSAVAINIPVYFQGQWVGSGGTSAAAPIWAAGLALTSEGLMIKKHIYYYGPAVFYYAANHAGNLHPFYNVTSGNNLYYNATPGWSYTSGLGTPNLVDFFNTLYSAQV